MTIGPNKTMSGDGTWTWTAEGFDPAKATVSGVPAELASNLVEGHTYAVTVTRSGNTFTLVYTDHTTGKEICKLVVTPGETVSKDVLIHVMAQVGTFATAFNAGTLIASLGDSAPIALYVIAFIGLAAIAFGLKKRFAK